VRLFECRDAPKIPGEKQQIGWQSWALDLPPGEIWRG
jgi:hypothetical protein